MAEYLPSGSDEDVSATDYPDPLAGNDLDGDNIQTHYVVTSKETETSYDMPDSETELTEDLSLLQIFLPNYSKKDLIADSSAHIEGENKGLVDKKVNDDSVKESFLEVFSKYIESLNLLDPLYLKILLEILSGELTEDQLFVNLPRYYQCKSSFISPTFSSDNHNTSVHEYINWVSKNKKVKGNCNAVPYGILPKGLAAEITDVKINCYRSDDQMYQSNQVLREKVARGNSFVTFYGKGVTNSGCVVRGLKKFSGGYWDDDDIQNTDHSGWSRYFISPPTSATSVVVMEKVNGEAAHVSVRLLGTKFLIFCGSKNVHLLVTRRQHLLKYEEQRYSYACVVGEAFFDLLEGMSEFERVRLLLFMSHTGFTAVCELLQPNNQHIVNLSYLSAPVIKFITWVPCDIGGVNTICSLPPNIAIDLATYLSLPAAKYSLIQIAELPAELASVRAYKQSEGVVLYFTNSKQEVIGLMKFKSIWYILLRAVREIIKYQMNQISKGKLKSHQAKINGTESIEKRFKRINKSLNLNRGSYLAWQDICTDFLEWVIDLTKFGKSISFYSQFPNMWDKFLKEKSLKEPPTLRKSI
ncbi:hypothetical protein LOD99_12504 [Oopsacas minuta]|uniref:DUF7920 domain-containing protein n=1 Tax=Oopsacas minuta TaxID=111878 RepID=A0AAV7JD29_9METZ|nr:hypothetical protein LOD99_12504 [Oopsacas minuta]